MPCRNTLNVDLFLWWGWWCTTPLGSFWSCQRLCIHLWWRTERLSRTLIPTLPIHGTTFLTTLIMHGSLLVLQPVLYFWLLPSSSLFTAVGGGGGGDNVNSLAHAAEELAKKEKTPIENQQICTQWLFLLLAVIFPVKTCKITFFSFFFFLTWVQTVNISYLVHLDT